MKQHVEWKLSGKLVAAAPAATAPARVQGAATSAGLKVGRLGGYIATWDLDTGGPYGVPDQFMPGAFAKSLAEHRARGNRPVRLRYMHGPTIGGFPISTVREDKRGLLGIAELNLEVPEGRAAWALARQGVLTDFSVGFVVVKQRVTSEVRFIDEVILVEGSIVDEPANRAARITAIGDGVAEERALERMFADISATRRQLNPLAALAEDLHETTAMLRRR